MLRKAGPGSAPTNHLRGAGAQPPRNYLFPLVRQHKAGVWGRSPRETTFSLSYVSTKRGFGGAAPEKSTFSLSCVSTKRGLEGAAPRKIPFHFSISFRDRKVKKPDQKAAVLLQPRKWGSGSDEMPVRRIQCHCVSICHVYKRTSRQKGAGIW